MKKHQTIALGTLGGRVSNATAINESGNIVGNAENEEGCARAFLYKQDGNKLINLGTLGGLQSSASAINSRGFVVGSAEIEDGVYHAFLYGSNSRELIDINVFEHARSDAKAINEQGHIVINSYSADKLTETLLFNLDTWETKQVAENIDYPCYGTAINNNDQVVGYIQSNEGARAFVYSSKSSVKPLSIVANDSFAFDINEQGLVTGYARQKTSFCAYIYDIYTDKIMYLDVAENQNCFARSINDNGFVVGTSQKLLEDNRTYYTYGFLYHDTMVDLNEIGIVTNLDNIVDATSINNSGYIVGSTTSQQAFLLKLDS
ncbi:DUF3466 family protein [Gloeobacter kilaueensis]|uniref:Uncharacterized protein n=1 Tax=Gloeobacter kilaueensis (strain ATCC BAA-2537 / CCAP 1431/1 / ULC 316 / JS1) TaxID=1183438 RepID=U5QNJ8_GLOK1|nr:DUF3466 family protein [Gloeobacter kilaueensis]AGY60562.1 hypothetical protein GKIL_4316 [Gloeobacter kilaueensis JS1]